MSASETSAAPRPLRLGLLVNPLAGVGGPAARKGSDGLTDSERESLQGNARAVERASAVLSGLLAMGIGFDLYVWGGAMGAAAARAAGCEAIVVGEPRAAVTTAADTHQAARALADRVDLLLFCGGDGTARDVCAAIGDGPLVLGIPAGVKMHSGVFALSPGAAVRLIDDLVAGRLVSSHCAEVRDLDEAALRGGRVVARTFGHLRVPAEHRFVQAVKSGGREDQALVQEDIAAEILERMANAGGLWLLGAGTTLAAVKRQLAGAGTLLGVDVAREGALIVGDACASQLEELVGSCAAQEQVHIVVSPIGGQGFVLGRGNQQLSPAVVRRAGAAGLMIAATRAKLLALDGRPLLLDTGDNALNAELDGWTEVITGYDDTVVYRLQGLT